MNAPKQNSRWRNACAGVTLALLTATGVSGCFTVNVGSIRNETVLSLVNARYQYLRCETALNNRRDLYDILVTDLDEGPLTDGGDDPLTGGHDGPLTGGHDGPLTGGHDGPLTGGHDDPLTGGHDKWETEQRSKLIVDLHEATEKCRTVIKNLDDRYGDCVDAFRSCAASPDVCATQYEACLDAHRGVDP